MSHETSNEREWNDPANWHGPGPFQFYGCDRDDRILVPKRHRSRGWTFNLGHPMGRFLLVTVLVLVFAALVVVAFTSGRPS
jgi:uncharacterized membrane protein